MRALSFRKCLATLVAAAGALLAASAPAQYTSDIDIYSRPTSTGDAANVLIILDNTGNWTAPFDNEIKALKATLEQLPADKFRVGLMMFTETGGGDTGNDGAYVRSAVRLLDSATKDKFKGLVNSFDPIADKSNSGKLGKTMAEAYYYFAGMAPYAGNNKNKTDYLGNTYGTSASKAMYALAGNALTSKAGTPYAGPVINGCQRNFIIYISNGAAQDSNADTTDASALLSAAYTAAGLTRPADITNLTPNGSQTNVADEWARFMRSSGQNVVTYAVDVDRKLPSHRRANVAIGIWRGRGDRVGVETVAAA